MVNYGGSVDLSQALSLREGTNIMISSTLKPHTNTHSVSRVCGRPTENVLERFVKGLLRGLYERSICERTFLRARSFGNILE